MGCQGITQLGGLVPVLHSSSYFTSIGRISFICFSIQVGPLPDILPKTSKISLISFISHLRNFISEEKLVDFHKPIHSYLNLFKSPRPLQLKVVMVKFGFIILGLGLSSTS